MAQHFPREHTSSIGLADLSTCPASTKQQPCNHSIEGVELLPQEITNQTGGHLPSSVPDELLHRHIDQPPVTKQKDSHWRPEQTSVRSYENELAMLHDAVTRFETEQQVARDKITQPEGTQMISPVQGVLEEAIGYIHYLQEQEKTLEQESEVLTATLTFWVDHSEVLKLL